MNWGCEALGSFVEDSAFGIRGFGFRCRRFANSPLEFGGGQDYGCRHHLNESTVSFYSMVWFADDRKPITPHPCTRNPEPITAYNPLGLFFLVDFDDCRCFGFRASMSRCHH